MRKPIRIGVAGLGEFGRFHARTLAKLAEFELAAVCDRNAASVRQAAEEHGVMGFADFEEMLAASRLDAVAIATRSDSHVPLAEQALARGLHAFVEKPLARNAGEIERLLALPRADRMVMVDHICLFHSAFGVLRQEVERRGFRSIRFVRNRSRTLVDRFPEEHPVTLTMMHDLCLAAVLASGREPSRIEGWQSGRAGHAADMAWARLEWPDGRSMWFESHWILPSGVPYDGWDHAEVFGEGFHLKVQTNPGPVQVVEDRHSWPIALEIGEVGGRPVGMLAECLRSFAENCHGAEVPEGCRLQDALQIQRWMDAIRSDIRQKPASA